MKEFVTFHYNKSPRDIRKDLISDYQDHLVAIVGRDSGYEFDVDETYEEIKEIMGGSHSGNCSTL